MANSKINGGASPYPKGASGDIITITDGAENTPLKSAVVNIEPVQSGSGDPSPTNIRPISGWSEVNVWVKPTYDTTLTPTATIPLGQTVYGGTLDVLAGKLTITRKTITLDGSQNILASKNNRFYFNIGEAFKVATSNQSTYAGVTSDRMKPMSWADLSDSYTVGDSACCGPVYGNGIAFRWSNITTAADWKTYFTNNPTQFTYELATPIEVDLTPQTIKTLLGTNNIWADAGSMGIEYYPAAASIVAVQNRSTKAYVSIPLGMIRYETYQITPQQTIDLDSYRSENGNLLRNPVATKCKIEFNTPLMTDSEWAEIWKIIKAGFNNNTERKLKLKYYDTLSATYKTGYFYVPDVQTTIRNIEEGAGVINYNEIRIAFIEY